MKSYRIHNWNLLNICKQGLIVFFRDYWSLFEFFNVHLLKLVLFCFVLFCFVLFCFVLFCFVLFCLRFKIQFQLHFTDFSRPPFCQEKRKPSDIWCGRYFFENGFPFPFFNFFLQYLFDLLIFEILLNSQNKRSSISKHIPFTVATIVQQ